MADSHDQRFREKIVDAPLDRASEALAEVACDMGWDRVAFHLDTGRLELPTDTDGIYLARRLGWSDEYLDAWLDRGVGRHCPVTERCGRIAEPFWWHTNPSAECWQPAGVSPPQARALAYYGEFSAGAATVPVHRPGGRTGYVSWFMRDRSRLNRLFARHYGAIHLISHYFVGHIDALGAPTGTAAVLTPRELECLTWAARGKTEEEIGMIIGRSRATARFHLRNATTKLGAANRVHAVGRACARGLITDV